MLAALAGALNAHTIGVISPDQYNFGLLVIGLTYAVVGGVSHWAGPLVAALESVGHRLQRVATGREAMAPVRCSSANASGA
jgi:ABC-type branched-subunit amino acid transport system permease subunit